LIHHPRSSTVMAPSMMPIRSLNALGRHRLG
jgi:hypothetical protein